MDQSQEKRGKGKIDWALSHMPLLARLRQEFEEDRPLVGHRVGMSIHLEAKTACLALLLRAGGARVAVTGSNPLSTQDDVAAALAAEGVEVYAKHGASEEEYFSDLRSVLATEPDLILDDGGDLVKLLHGELDLEIRGGCEETTTGVHRLRILERRGELRFPMFAVNDARMKYLFDNRYGTGQSVWDGIMRSTNLLVAGKKVLVAGYGWCGRGIAMRASGLGARVLVCEVDPVRAVEAVMDGFSVGRMEEMIAQADFLVTSTGCCDVVTEGALAQAKDGLVMANAGHFDVEIDKGALARLAVRQERVRDGIERFILADDRSIYLLGEGRLVNLVLGDGHPVEIMDISFALQALTLRHIVESEPLPPALYPVPREIDDRVARMKLSALGVTIDALTKEQEGYLGLSRA